MRRRTRLQYGGVYLDKRYGIWYYRRSVNGKRKLQPVGTLAEYPTKAAAKEAAKAYVDPNSKPKSPSFEFAVLRYMASKRMPQTSAYRCRLPELSGELLSASLEQRGAE